MVFDRLVHRTDFPYAPMLQGQLRALKQNVSHLHLPMPVAGTQHTLFNFWKATLCHKGDPSFEFSQEQEARVRLFANMFWAAFASLLPCTAGLVLALAGQLGSGWALTMLFAVFLSAAICVIFGSQIRRVRGHEVLAVFLAYAAMQADEQRSRPQDGHPANVLKTRLAGRMPSDGMATTGHEDA